MQLLQGYNLGGFPLLAIGAGKGVAGAFMRPTIGALEGASKASYALSLACLGKRGIVGASPLQPLSYEVESPLPFERLFE